MATTGGTSAAVVCAADRRRSGSFQGDDSRGILSGADVSSTISGVGGERTADEVEERTAELKPALREQAPSPTERKWGWFFRLWDDGLMPRLYQAEVVLVSALAMAVLLIFAMGRMDKKLIFFVASTAALGSALLLFHVPSLIVYLVALPSPVRRACLRQWPLQFAVPFVGALAAAGLLLAMIGLKIADRDPSQRSLVYAFTAFAATIAAIYMTAVASKEGLRHVVAMRFADSAHKVALPELTAALAAVPLRHRILYKEAADRIQSLFQGGPMTALRKPRGDGAQVSGFKQMPTMARGKSVPIDAPLGAFLERWRMWIEHGDAENGDMYTEERMALLEAVAMAVDSAFDRGAGMDWAARVEEEARLGRDTDYGPSQVLGSILARLLAHPFMALAAGLSVSITAALPIATAFAQAALLGVFASGPATAAAYAGPLALLCALNALEALMTGAAALSLGVLAKMMQRDMQQDLFCNVCGCRPDAPAFNDGDMAKRFAGEIVEVGAFLEFDLAWSVLAPLATLAAGVVGLIQLDWLFGGVYLMTVPAGFVLSLNYPRAALAEAADHEAELSDAFTNYAGLRRLLSLFSACRHALSLAAPKISASFRAQRRAAVKTNVAAGFALIWQRIIIVVAIVYATVMFAPRPDVVASLVAFLQILGELIDPVDDLSDGLFAMTEVGASVERVDEAAGWLPSERSYRRREKRRSAAKEASAGHSAAPAPVPDFRTDVEFRGVAFAYTEGKPVLRKVDVILRAGQYTAVVGFSGAGKSTLFGLLTREIAEDAGQVLVGGTALSTFETAAIRSQLGVVMQKVAVIDGTVADNVRIGKPSATMAEVEAASRAAECHDFVSGLLQGYETVLGSQAEVSLSGGQLQRISLARALVRQPSMLLLDEATSALDPTTEAAVIQTLVRLVAATGMSVLSITHRLSTAMPADNVVVLKDGYVVEQGNPHDLLQNTSGGFYQLVHAADTAPSPASAPKLATALAPAREDGKALLRSHRIERLIAGVVRRCKSGAVTSVTMLPPVVNREPAHEGDV